MPGGDMENDVMRFHLSSGIFLYSEQELLFFEKVSLAFFFLFPCLTPKFFVI